MHGRSRQGAGVLIEVDRVRSRHRALEELRTGLFCSGLQGVCPAPRSVGADGVFLSFNAVRKFNLRSRRGGRRARRRSYLLYVAIFPDYFNSNHELDGEGRGQGFYVGLIAQQEWQQTYAALKGNLWLKHVKGHSQHKWNDLADELAARGRKGEVLTHTVVD